MQVFQSFNKRIKAYVKFKRLSNGRTTIMDVKEKNPSKPFKGIPINNKSSNKPRKQHKKK